MAGARTGEPRGETRFFAQGGFFTADRKARLIAPETPAPHAELSAQFPFRLNTGRVRDQWHTMTRSGFSPRLAAHVPEPFVEVHPDDAAAAGLADGGFARVRSPYGACVLKVVVSEGQRRGSLFAPIHWSDETASSARIGDLVAPATDPYSGQPEAKATPAAIEPVEFRFRGFALSRLALAMPAETWWSRVTVANGTGLLLASNQPPDAWREHAKHLFGAGAEIAEYFDEPRGSYRMAAFVDGRLVGCAVHRAGGDGAAVGRGQGAVRGGSAGRRAAARGAVGQIDRRPRRSRPGDLRLLRRRPQCHPRGDRQRPGCERRGHRQGAARRHQLRLVLART